MTRLLNKVAGVILAGALVAGTGLTALAETPGNAQPPARTRQADKAKPEQTAEQKQQHEALRRLHAEIKAAHEKIVAEREALHGKRQTIRDLVKALKQDEEKNRNALEKARVDLRELRIIHDDVKVVNGKLKALRGELKAAIQAKEADKAAGIGRQILSLQQTKLDLLKVANNKASQAIAHLKGAADGDKQ